MSRTANNSYEGFASKASLILFLNNYFLVSYISYSYYASKYSQTTLSIERYNELKQLI